MSVPMSKLPPRYAVSDWVTSNKLISLNAERIRDSSHTIRQDARKLRNETESHTKWTQHESNTKIEKRIDDINEWKVSLERCLEETDKEIQALQNEKKNLEIALEAKKLPLDVAMECLLSREEREGIDLVRDNVEHQLHKEVEVIEGIKALLQQKIAESFEQLCLLEEARHQIHCDLTDKNHALGIDAECHSLYNNSDGIDFQNNPTRTVKGSVTPETWNSFSEYNKNRGEAEIKASQRLREAIFATLEKTRNDLDAQHRATNYEYRKRIHETDQAKNELEWQKKNTEDEVATMEQDIVGLKESIEAKMGPMMSKPGSTTQSDRDHEVAQTRLEKRTQRKSVELCRDIPQYQLCYEVAEIDGSVRALSEKHQVAVTALKSLLQDLNRITEDLRIKTKSLALDQHCMEVRQKLSDPAANVTTDQNKDQLDDQIKNLSIASKQHEARPSSLRDERQTSHTGRQTTLDQRNDSMPQQSQLSKSTYITDFDETKNKRSGDLQRTLGQRKIVEFA